MTRPSFTDGVVRGPSPRSYGNAPSPPLRNSLGSQGASSIGVAQRSAPVAASTAAQYSRRPLPSSLEIIVNARPWLIAKVLNPFVRDIFVHTTKPGLLVAQVVAIGSGETPSVVGPRYCGQSVANPA